MSNVVDFHPKHDRIEHIDTPTDSIITLALEDALFQQKLVVIRGGFGCGKSHSCKRFAARYSHAVALATLDPTASSMSGALSVIREALQQIQEQHPGIFSVSSAELQRPSGLNAVVREGFRSLSMHCEALLIVDEVQNAKPDVLDTLRAFNDEGLCGLAIVGNERLFNPRRGRMVAADFGAVLSRAHHAIDIPGPTAGDIDTVLDAYSIPAQQSRQLLHERAAGGGLREVLAIIEKARAMSGTSVFSHKHIKAAASTTGLSAFSSTTGRR